MATVLISPIICYKLNRYSRRFFYFCIMMLSNIDIEIKGDHYWEPAEQEYHEAFIDHFKFELSNWLDRCGVRTNNVICFNIYYIPIKRKFYIAKINKREADIIEELKRDTRFYSKYFTHSFIGRADDE